MHKQLLFLNYLQQNGSSDLINFIEIEGIDKAEQQTIIKELLDLKLIRTYKYTVCLTVKGKIYLESLRSERFPIQKPYVTISPVQVILYHIGVFIFNILKKEWFISFIIAVMALIFGTWVCVKIGLLK